MTRLPSALLLGVLFGTAPSLIGQQSGRRPEGDSLRAQRRDTTKTDTTKGPKVPPADPLTRFLGAFTARGLGPAAYSGRVTAIAVPKPYHKIIYAGSAGGGVWKTVNAGITWQPISDSLGAQSIGDVAVAASDTNVIWVGTGEKNSLRSASWGNGVHKSTDGGKTWKHMGLADTRSIGRVVIHPTDPNIVYVAALGHLWGPNPERGVYKTADGGKTWTRSLFVDDSTGFVDLEMDPSNPELLYAASWHRVRWGGPHMEGVGKGSALYRTTDGGRSWKKLTDPSLRNGLPSAGIGRTGLDISASNPRTVYAMVQVDRGMTEPSRTPFGGVFRSDDAGETWKQLNDLQPIPSYYYNDIWIDPTNSEHAYITSSPLLESKDGGKTWVQDTLQLVHVDNHALFIDPADPKHMILGNDGGVYITWDGGKAWEHEAIPIGQFYTVTVDSAQTPYTICGGLQDNGVWCGPSASRDSLGITDSDWYSVNGGDGMHVQLPPNDPYTIYSEYQFGSMSKLDLRTGKREPIQPMNVDAGSESGYALRWGWTTPMVQSQHDSAVLYVGANHLIRMRNGGKDWEIVGPDMTRGNRRAPEPEAGYTSYQALYSIAESPRSADILWTGSDDGLVWVTRDGGKTWANVTRTFPKAAPTRCFVSHIAASRFAEATAYVVYDCHHRDEVRPHVWRTTDFGVTWTEIGAGLPPDGGSLTIFEDVRNPRLLFVGTEFGAFATVDGGKRWRRFPKGLPPVRVQMFSASYEARDLVISTHGRGIWTVNIGALEEHSDSLLERKAHLFSVPPALQYRYSDSYPNFGARPFIAQNPGRGAVISYWLRDALDRGVQFIITDARGDTVKKLNAPAYAGLQRVTWALDRDAPRPRELGGPTSVQELRRVEPGEYTISLKAAGVTMTQKILVKEWPKDRLGRVR
ncbi:MAG: WD40/YVTN/BNR-like repeat-containing protein [Gemmatimonadaceae bacterium]